MQRGVYGVLEKTNRSIDSKPVIQPDEYVPMLSPDKTHWFDIHPMDVEERRYKGWTVYDPPENHNEQLAEKVDDINSVKPANDNKACWYKGKHKGQTLYILGCGSSLTPEIGQKLMRTKAVTIGVNDIFRLVNKNNFIPTYHLHVDYKDDKKENQFSAINYENLKYIKERGSVLFSPTDYGLEPTCDLGDEHFFSDPTIPIATDFDYENGILRLGSSCSSIYQALQLAIIMEANPIILLGVDYYIQRKGKGFGDIHFYDEYIKPEKKTSNQYKATYQKRLDRMREELELSIDKHLKPILSERGILVFNGNQKSMLESFTKLNVSGFLE